MIEKHSSYNLGQNILGRAGDAGVEQQVTRSILRVGKQVGWQTAYERLLSQLLGRLEQLHTPYHTAILVLPSAAGGQQLLKYESALAYLDLIPGQSAEIAYGTEHRRSEYAAGAETATRRYGRKECNLQSASHMHELVTQRSEMLGAELRMESSQCEGGLGYRERRTDFIEIA